MTDAPLAARADIAPGIRHLPLPIFASVVGVTGLALAWRRAPEAIGFLPTWVAEALLALAVVWFLVVASLYAAKAALHWRVARAEARHPVQSNYINFIPVAGLLIGTALAPVERTFAEALWLVGALGNLAFAVVIVPRWLFDEFAPTDLTPAWVIPVVGNVLPPLAGVILGHAELSWLCFSAGFGFWIVLFPLIVGRLIFAAPLPPRVLPSYVILVAPPSVMSMSFLELLGGPNPASRLLFYLSLFLAICLATRARALLAQPFSLAYLSFTFPSAALAGAALRHHQAVGSDATQALALLLLLLSTGIVLVIFAATLRHLLSGALFRQSA